MTRTRRIVFCIAITFASLTDNVTEAIGQAARRVVPPAAGTDLSSSLEATARVVSPTVVEIFTTSHVPGQAVVPRNADLVTTQRASGSGVIVDPEGFIITNAHVVAGAERLRLEVPIPAEGKSILARSSRSVSGRIVGIDLETDLAVIKIDDRNLPALPFGDSDELKPGQLVLAFGSPLGFHNSVSMGIVSAVARQLEPESPMIYLQTDASINPGSSGGPLVDLQGKLIGINTLIVSPGGGNDGLGFAAPSNIVRSVYEQLKKTGRVRRGDIGLKGQTITPALASGLGLSRDYGVVLADVVPGSPADRAGIRPGDVVASLDGKPMENARQLQVGLYRRTVGDVLSLEILRGRQFMNVSVSVVEREDPFGILSTPIDPRQNLVSPLGILGINLDEHLAAAIPALRVKSGVVVASTVEGAIDSRDGGLAAGDIIYAVNRTPVSGLTELRSVLDKLSTGDHVVLQLERRGELMYLAFTIE